MNMCVGRAQAVRLRYVLGGPSSGSQTHGCPSLLCDYGRYGALESGIAVKEVSRCEILSKIGNCRKE